MTDSVPLEPPAPLDRLASQLQALLARAAANKREFVSIAMETAAVLLEARDRFSSDTLFGQWLVANGIAINGPDRAALIAMARQPEAMRRCLEETERRSLQLIYREEFNRYFSGKKADAEAEPFDQPKLGRPPKTTTVWVTSEPVDTPTRYVPVYSEPVETPTCFLQVETSEPREMPTSVVAAVRTNEPGEPERMYAYVLPAKPTTKESRGEPELVLSKQQQDIVAGAIRLAIQKLEREFDERLAAEVAKRTRALDARYAKRTKELESQFGERVERAAAERAAGSKAPAAAPVVVVGKTKLH